MRNRGVNDPAKSAARQPTRSEGVVHATVPGVTVVGREVGTESGHVRATSSRTAVR